MASTPAIPLEGNLGRYLQEILRSVGGQRRRAAEILGISRKTLWKKLKQLGLE